MRAILVLSLWATVASATPRELPFTWTTRTQDVGTSQLEAWVTPRLIRTDDYLRMDSRLVFSHGVTTNLDTQLSMDFDFEHRLLSASFDPQVTSLWRWTTWRQKSPFAMGGIGRASLGFDHAEFEGRLLADLRLDRVLLALNVSASRALLWNGRTGVDTRLEEDVGLQYRVTPALAVGLEVRGRSAWAGREYFGTAAYVGPNITFSYPSFWVTFGMMVQVAAQKATQDADTAEKQELRDNERFQLRLSFGLPAR